MDPTPKLKKHEYKYTVGVFLVYWTDFIIDEERTNELQTMICSVCKLTFAERSILAEWRAGEARDTANILCSLQPPAVTLIPQPQQFD